METKDKLKAINGNTVYRPEQDSGELIKCIVLAPPGCKKVSIKPIGYDAAELARITWGGIRLISYKDIAVFKNPAFCLSTSPIHHSYIDFLIEIGDGGIIPLSYVLESIEGRSTLSKIFSGNPSCPNA